MTVPEEVCTPAAAQVDLTPGEMTDVGLVENGTVDPSLSVPQLIKGLFQLQEQRAGIFNRFKRCFTETLASGDEGVYTTSCQAFTEEFNQCSQAVRQIEAGLSGGLHAQIVRNMQEAEKTKLQMTCTLQVLKKAYHAQAWDWQQEEEGAAPPPPAETEDAPPRVHPQSWTRCSCTGPECTEPTPDPTREEYYAAVAEATQKLEAAMQEVNMIMEELRYEIEDEDEDEDNA